MVGLGVLIEAERCFSVIAENSTNTCTLVCLFFLLKHREAKSSSDIIINRHCGVCLSFVGQSLSKQLYISNQKGDSIHEKMTSFITIFRTSQMKMMIKTIGDILLYWTKFSRGDCHSTGQQESE